MEESSASAVAAPPKPVASPAADPPVMDVKPPANDALAVKAAPPDASDSDKPAAAQSSQTAVQEKPKSPEKDAKPAIKHTQPAAAKPAQTGVTLAIVATVIIVLGLAVLATVAYIKT